MKAESGFAMLEVLVSFLVIMIGVLGLAGLQMKSIINTEVAEYQSVATLLAENMTTAIQANAAYWNAPPASITLTGSTISGGPTSACSAAAPCLATILSAAQIAAYDLNNLNLGLASLPNGGATIACVTASPPTVCTINLTWSEKNVSLFNPTGTETGQLASGTSQTHSYQTMVNVQ